MQNLRKIYILSLMDGLIDMVASEINKEDTKEKLREQLIKPLLQWMLWELFPFILLGWFSCVIFAILLITVLNRHKAL